MNTGLDCLAEGIQWKVESIQSGREIRIMVPGLSFIIVLERESIGMKGWTISYYRNGKKWYHIVFTNSGLSGKYARTYVNGTFATGTQRFERRVLNELMVDRSSDLKIGAAPDHGNGGYFLGIIDDVRLYNKGFGSEDVYHLYRGDPGVVDYEEPRLGSRFGMNGTITKVSSPSLPLRLGIGPDLRQ